MALRTFGHIANNPVGTAYADRDAAAAAGVHRPRVAGICGGEKEGAESIVVSGGYPDDLDYGDLIIYTGHGGRDPSTKKQTQDQVLKEGNLALARSCLDGLPVRLIRGSDGDKNYSPPSGYRYDGLYRVDGYWHDIGRDGFRIWRYRLVAIQGDAATFPPLTVPPTHPLPRRTPTTTQRIVRNTKTAEEVKMIHNYTCQVCGIQLITPAGRYAEAAHIQALGVPHNGPDTKENLLCLCPNDHVRFDTGTIVIDDSYQVWESSSAKLIGPMRLHARHAPGRNFIAYHRQYFGN